MSDVSEEALRRAEQAQYILEHPLVIAAFADLEADFVTAWRGSPVLDREAREEAYRMLRVLDAVRRAFMVHVDTGKVVRDNLDAAERAKAVAAISPAV